MAIAETRTTSLWDWIEPSRFRIRVARSAASQVPEIDAECARQRREFICDMLECNSEAFCNELDVHNMMSAYPGRF